jgi:hypothetical protein
MQSNADILLLPTFCSAKLMHEHVNPKNGDPAPLVSDEVYQIILEVGTATWGLAGCHCLLLSLPCMLLAVAGVCSCCFNRLVLLCIWTSLAVVVFLSLLFFSYGAASAAEH